MKYSVDVNSEYQKAKSKIFRYSLLFAFTLAITLTIDTLLVVFAKEDYTLNLVIAIIISILLSWFTIFYFTNIYSDLNATYRFFKGISSGIQTKEEVKVNRGLDENLTFVNGLYVYPVSITSYDGLTSTDKIIYLMDDSLDLQNGDKLSVATYQRIVLEAEKHQ